ncbi:hypothetical protein [Paractinoplanes durhamensis]|uniref:hypothetical protein n=1 Tax=Paractinoplanes durhamensis TaxID=113563 RepID=UPI0036317180
MITPEPPVLGKQHATADPAPSALPQVAPHDPGPEESPGLRGGQHRGLLENHPLDLVGLRPWHVSHPQTFAHRAAPCRGPVDNAALPSAEHRVRRVPVQIAPHFSKIAKTAAR